MAILRKLKDKMKKMISQRKVASDRQKITASITQEKIPGFQETLIEGTKFSYPNMPHPKPVMPQELPIGYGQDRMVLQVRDTHWMHAYWEIKQATVDKVKNELGDSFYQARRMLRVYDVSYIIFNGKNANSFFDIQVNEFANNWYIDTNSPGRFWCVDFGLLLPDGRFITLLRSNIVQTPLDGPSWITDEEWMIPEDMFARLYGMGFGLGRSSPVGKGWQEKVRREFISSPGVSSSPVKKAIKERQFWMWVDCELIVYGATEPNAKVAVQNKAINLRPDGTFTLRFSLPNGRQVIPVKAVSADNIEERTVTPIINRETK